MTRNRVGIVLGVIGSALGAWFWTRHRGMTARAANHRQRQHGEVIFSNTPTPAEGDVL